jgi:integrase/recombinase XerD
MSESTSISSEEGPTDEELIENFESDVEYSESISTAGNYKKNLEAFEEWLRENKDKRLLEAEKRDIQDHITEMKQEDYGNKTIGSRFTPIQVFYKWLKNEGYRDNEPTSNLTAGVDTDITRQKEERRSEKPIAVTEEEKEKLCDHVPNPKIRNELMIRLMFQTGVREKELRNIRVDDVDREQREIGIKDAKSDKNKTIYYTDLEPWLTMWLDEGRRDSMRSADDSPYLFISNQHGQFSRGRPNKIIKQAAKNAGIQETVYEDNNGLERKRITSHALRHGFARYCVKQGMDISYLKELMRHENLETTKQYLAFTDEDKREAVQKYGPRPDPDR